MRKACEPIVFRVPECFDGLRVKGSQASSQSMGIVGAWRRRLDPLKHEPVVAYCAWRSNAECLLSRAVGPGTGRGSTGQPAQAVDLRFRYSARGVRIALDEKR